MGNPFDDDDPRCYVLINEEGRCALWPVFVAVPGGWTIAHGPARRRECLDYAESRWIEPRPAALLGAMRLKAN
ncbi:MbtH family protein [Nocardia sp. NPDC051570]|uniref:MbtH family protein n=1 Tax=Nocardia sp. NPDC051570 TaxID=3364324 RepID=UPI0037A8F253